MWTPSPLTETPIGLVNSSILPAIRPQSSPAQCAPDINHALTKTVRTGGASPLGVQTCMDTEKPGE